MHTDWEQVWQQTEVELQQARSKRLQEIVFEADADGNGLISFDEFEVLALCDASLPHRTVPLRVYPSHADASMPPCDASCMPRPHSFLSRATARHDAGPYPTASSTHRP